MATSKLMEALLFRWNVDGPKIRSQDGGKQRSRKTRHPAAASGPSVSALFAPFAALSIGLTLDLFFFVGSLSTPLSLGTKNGGCIHQENLLTLASSFS